MASPVAGAEACNEENIYRCCGTISPLGRVSRETLLQPVSSKRTPAKAANRMRLCCCVPGLQQEDERAADCMDSWARSFCFATRTSSMFVISSLHSAVPPEPLRGGRVVNCHALRYTAGKKGLSVTRDTGYGDLGGRERRAQGDRRLQRKTGGHPSNSRLRCGSVECLSGFLTRFLRSRGDLVQPTGEGLVASDKACAAGGDETSDPTR